MIQISIVVNMNLYDASCVFEDQLVLICCQLHNNHTNACPHIQILLKVEWIHEIKGATFGTNTNTCATKHMPMLSHQCPQLTNNQNLNATVSLSITTNSYSILVQSRQSIFHAMQVNYSTVDINKT